MATDLSIADLIANGTLSAGQAATLWAMVEEQHSFVVVAIPRLAGKTTMMNAILGLLPPTVSVHRLSGDEAEMAKLKEAAKGGYLVASEISPGPVHDYIWGPPTLRLFDTLTVGYSLATAMHASGPEETFTELCVDNGISDEDVSRIDFMLYIKRFGQDRDTYWRRLDQVNEIDHVSDGKPHVRLLHRWEEALGCFSVVEQPRSLRIDAAHLAQRAELLQGLVCSGRTTPAHIASLVAECSKDRGNG